MASQDVTVRFTGKFFDGVAELLVEKYIGDLERVLGERALNMVDDNLDASIRVNHHVYTSFIRMTQDPRGQVVDDGWSVTNDLPYGLWLEGIGSRNAPVTRFEGYHSFEKAAADLNAQAEEIAYDLLGKYVEEMNA